MRAELIGTPVTVMANPNSKHNYFGWPTAVRLRDGRIAIAASGFRTRHIDPFGKAVISFSADDGRTYTQPTPVIDTVLDDRDGGLTPFGESGLIISTFNNTLEFQRSQKNINAYSLTYLDTVAPWEEARDLGSLYRVSFDNGVTFGKIYKCPVSSPHGPLELRDGTILYVGSVFHGKDDDPNRQSCNISVYKIDTDGKCSFIGEIPSVDKYGNKPLFCEPHAIELADSRLLCHIRVQANGENRMFTLYQSISCDGGASWSTPRQILDDLGGAPSHLFCHSSGVLVATYGYRELPFGIRAMFSRDGGASWDIGHVLYSTDVSADLGYPSTVELGDGSMITVFYARPDAHTPPVIMQQRWKLCL